MHVVEETETSVLLSRGDLRLMELDAAKHVSSMFVLLAAAWPVTRLGGTLSCSDECCVE